MLRFDLSSNLSPGLGRGVGQQIWVSGSIARDLIMDFPGRFVDYIDPKKIHVLNLSFGVKDLKQNLGGTAANIAYNLALLGERSEVLGNIGAGDVEFISHFRRLRTGTRYLRQSRTEKTAAAYIITDRNDNQITGFYAGAMSEDLPLPAAAKAGDWAVIAAENPRNMARLAKFYARRGVNYIFDPGQQITALSRAQLAAGLRGAAVLVGNDYEISLMASSLRGHKAEANSSVVGLLRFARKDTILVRTLGPKGSEIYGSGKKIKIGIAKPRRVLDPTGAGDAYRGGFLKGLILGYNLETCGELGATVASFAVEEYGTQNHKFTWREALRRHNLNFKERLSFRT